MKFKNIKIEGWKQFGEIDIDFDPRITILTGANGSGKTTILNMLARHWGWHSMELSTPVKDEESGIIRFFQNLFGTREVQNKIGVLTYDDNKKTDLLIPANNAAQVQVQFSSQGSVEGLNIPSHRPHFNYQPVSQLSVQKRDKEQAFQLVKQNNYERLTGGNGNGRTANYYIKETLITWGVYGFGNEKIVSDNEQVDFYNGFEEVLRKMLPPSIGFREFSILNGEIVLKTKSGDFMIDAVSGGLSAIIDLSWQIYMYSTKERKSFVVLIDEIENHLHPTLQRSILPSLLATFPDVQFIVTTHNPLIVGSVKNSNVYALQYKEQESKNRVFSTKLDLINKAKAASDVLRDILGVEFTMPIWVEDELVKITQSYSKKELNQEKLDEMRGRLKELGLEDLMPQTLIKILQDDKAQ